MAGTKIPSATTIASLGHYAPERRVTNAELEGRLGLEAGWIERRTGIRERRYAAPSQALSDLALAAGSMALARSGLSPERIALLVLATSTPDHLLPPTAPLVAHRLGLSKAGAIDMAGACGGFLYALTFADSYVRVHNAPVLVIAANILSRRTNPLDRASVVLFGDAAGAALVVPSGRPGTGVLGVNLAADGSGYDLIKIEAGGSRTPFTSAMDKDQIQMRIADGRTVFSKASDMMAKASHNALTSAGLTLAGIDYWIPHQANARLIAATRAKLAIDAGKALSSVALYGNSSAATIPLTLSLAAEGGTVFKPGDTLLISAAGAGLTGGGLVYRL
jgi:3-oxoacyl-[acyl-carrier-protein] synthase III